MLSKKSCKIYIVISQILIHKYRKRIKSGTAKNHMLLNEYLFPSTLCLWIQSTLSQKEEGAYKFCIVEKRSTEKMLSLVVVHFIDNNHSCTDSKTKYKSYDTACHSQVSDNKLKNNKNKLNSRISDIQECE